MLRIWVKKTLIVDKIESESESESERESFGYIYKKIVWSLKKLLAVTIIWSFQIVS